MYSAHAQTRCQQRAITSEVVETLLTYGDRRRRAGADVYYLSRRSRRRAAAALGDRYRGMEKALNSYIVVGNDGAIITAAHRQKRLKF